MFWCGWFRGGLKIRARQWSAALFWGGSTNMIIFFLGKNWPSHPSHSSLSARPNCWLSRSHSHIQNRPLATRSTSQKSLYGKLKAGTQQYTLSVDIHAHTYTPPSIPIFLQCLYIRKDSSFSNMGAVSPPPPLHFTGLACLQRHLKAHKAGKWNRL